MKLTALSLSWIFMVTSALSLGSQTALAKPRQGLGLCGAAALPVEVQQSLKRDFPFWRIQDSADLSRVAHERWEAEKPLRCPGVAIARFTNSEAPAYAILLVPKQPARSGFRFVLVTAKVGQPPYQSKVLAQSDEGEGANLFIRYIRIADFFDRNSIKRFQVHATEGILLIAAGENEYEADVYFWSRNDFQHEPIDY